MSMKEIYLRDLLEMGVTFDEHTWRVLAALQSAVQTHHTCTLVYDNDPEADKYLTDEQRARSGYARNVIPMGLRVSQHGKLYVLVKHADQPDPRQGWRTYALAGMGIPIADVTSFDHTLYHPEWFKTASKQEVTA